MRCPDWVDLVSVRDRSPVDPPGWDEAVAHLPECAVCRDEAERLDPTLVFRRLAPPIVTDNEVASMQERVRLLVESSELAQRREPARSQLGVAAAAIAMLFLLGSFLVEVPTPTGTVAEIAPSGDVRPVDLDGMNDQPVLELLGDEPFEQVVETTGEDVSVVLLVDERFDV